MTASELAALIGREGFVPMAASNNAKVRIEVDVRIIDGRSAFGREDVLVEPLSGAGKAWVSLDNVTLYEEKS